MLDGIVGHLGSHIVFRGAAKPNIIYIIRNGFFDPENIFLDTRFVFLCLIWRYLDATWNCRPSWQPYWIFSMILRSDRWALRLKLIGTPQNPCIPIFILSARSAENPSIFWFSRSTNTNVLINKPIYATLIFGDWDYQNTQWNDMNILFI